MNYENNKIPEGFKVYDDERALDWDDERALDWDDEIENDGPDFILLPEGDYDFEITTFERATHTGSEKLPPCKKAIVHIKVTGAEGSTTIKHNLFLHTKTEGMLCAFFLSIGQRKKGEKLKMNWNMVPGATGRLKLGIRNYTNDKGETRQYNEIKRFYEANEKTTIAPVQTAQEFTPGKF
ncbi:MAG: hypothetical protein ACOX4U_00570 [Anaerovoracaceae bacterium]